MRKAIHELDDSARLFNASALHLYRQRFSTEGHHEIDLMIPFAPPVDVEALRHRSVEEIGTDGAFDKMAPSAGIGEKSFPLMTVRCRHKTGVIDGKTR